MKFEVGEKVKHKEYGEGKVICIDSGNSIGVEFKKKNDELHDCNERAKSHTEEEGDLKCYILVSDTGVAVNGTGPELLTMLTALQKRLVELGISQELVEESARIAFLNEKDMLKKIKEKLNKLMEENENE